MKLNLIQLLIFEVIAELLDSFTLPDSISATIRIRKLRFAQGGTLPPNLVCVVYGKNLEAFHF
jgi:hypothetical protein